MKKVKSIILILSFILAFIPVVYADDVIEIHVSTDGKPEGSGSIYDPVDGLESARLAVQKQKTRNPGTPINVLFHEGTYRLKKSVQFTQADSGTEKAPITYMAVPGEKVSFKGSEVIDLTKIKPVEDAKILAKLPRTSRNKVGYIDLAEQGFNDLGQIPDATSMYYTESSFEYSEIFLNDRQQIMARWPNGFNGYEKMASVVNQGGRGKNGVGGVFETKDYRLMNWVDAKDAWVVGFFGTDYMYDRVKLGAIDVNKKQITLKNGSGYGLRSSSSQRYAVINLLEELDMPGEYYIDHEKNILYYYPETSLKNAVMEVTTLGDDLLKITSLKNVNFKNLNFEQTRGCAIRAYDDLENMTITGCTFNNIGRYAIWHWTNKVSEVGQNNTQSIEYRENGWVNVHVDGNIFSNIGTFAVRAYCGSKDKNELSNCTFNNNYFYNLGIYDRASRSLNIFGVGVDIANNTQHYGGYGIVYQGSDINVHNNELYNLMNQLSDGGAIYTGRNFINRNNKIYENYLHDIIAKNDFITSPYAHAIYLDDMESGHEVFRNIVARANNGVVINCGMSNNVHDNTFIDCSKNGVMVSMFGMGNKDNIERQTTQALNALKNPAYDRFPDIKADFDSGLIAYPARNTIVGNNAINAPMSYSDSIMNDYYNVIKDNNTLTKDDFVDADNMDYRILNKSIKTQALGEDYDMSKIGVQVSEFEENPMKCEPFHLIYPKNGTIGIDTDSLTFSWERPIGADRFRIVVAKDPELKNVICDAETYETVYTLNNLKASTTYYWKVYAKNDSLYNYDWWESVGVNYMFTTANTFVTDKANLTAVRIAAENKLGTIIEGNEIGQYKPGTKAAIEDKLKILNEVLTYGGLTHDEESELIADIDNLINSDDLVNGGYINLGTFIEDEENWEVNIPEAMQIDKENKSIKIQYDEKEAVLGYTGIYEASRVIALKFKLKIDFNDKDGNINNDWLAMGLRGTKPTEALYNKGNDQYFMLIKEGLLEYQKNSGGNDQLLATVEDPSIKSGEWMDIDFGVINLGGVGQLTILKINGRVAYQTVDYSSNMVLTKGCFQIMQTKGLASEFRASDEEIEGFDELKEEYTAKMTEDLCKSMEKENAGNPLTVLRAESYKAYVDGKLKDISSPVIIEDDKMLIGIDTAAEVFGGSAAGNRLQINTDEFIFNEQSLSYTHNSVEKNASVQAKSENGKLYVELASLIRDLNKKSYTHNGKLIYIGDEFDVHTANAGDIMNGAMGAFALYQNK